LVVEARKLAARVALIAGMELKLPGYRILLVSLFENRVLRPRAVRIRDEIMGWFRRYDVRLQYFRFSRMTQQLGARLVGKRLVGEKIRDNFFSTTSPAHDLGNSCHASR
jgi:hypothetical protein